VRHRQPGTAETPRYLTQVLLDRPADWIGEPTPPVIGMACHEHGIRKRRPPHSQFGEILEFRRLGPCDSRSAGSRSSARAAKNIVGLVRNDPRSESHIAGDQVAPASKYLGVRADAVLPGRTLCLWKQQSVNQGNSDYWPIEILKQGMDSEATEKADAKSCVDR